MMVDCSRVCGSVKVAGVVGGGDQRLVLLLIWLKRRLVRQGERDRDGDRRVSMDFALGGQLGEEVP